MSTPTPSIPGVDRDALIEAIWRDAPWTVGEVAHAALDYIAARHECACDREHGDEWVELETWGDFPKGALVRREWKWDSGDAARFFIHRDDLPDPDADLVERMAKAIHVRDCGCGGLDDCVEPEDYRAMARAALAVVREEDR